MLFVAVCQRPSMMDRLASDAPWRWNSPEVCFKLHWWKGSTLPFLSQCQVCLFFFYHSGRYFIHLFYFLGVCFFVFTLNYRGFVKRNTQGLLLLLGFFLPVLPFPWLPQTHLCGAVVCLFYFFSSPGGGSRSCSCWPCPGTRTIDRPSKKAPIRYRTTWFVASSPSPRCF